MRRLRRFRDIPEGYRNPCDLEAFSGRGDAGLAAVLSFVNNEKMDEYGTDGAASERLLTEIRDLQRELVALQERTTELVERQYARAEKLQARAEAMQDKSEGMVEQGRRLFVVIVPILIGLIAYVSWLLFGRLGH